MTAMSIGYNSAASSILSNLNNVQNEMNSSYQQLSTGNAVNSAADNPASYAISQQMTSQVNGLNQATQNAQNGISMIQTATGAMNQIEQVLQTMSTLATEASNAGNTFSDNANLQLEMNALAQQINSTTNQTQYNGINLLTGQFGTGNTNLQLQIGANQDQTLSFNINSTDAVSLGVAGAQATGVAETAAATYGTSSVGTILNNASQNTTPAAAMLSGGYGGSGLSTTANAYKLSTVLSFGTSGAPTSVTFQLQNSGGDAIGQAVTLNATQIASGATITVGNAQSGQTFSFNTSQAQLESMYTQTTTGQGGTYSQTDALTFAAASMSSADYTAGTVASGSATSSNGAVQVNGAQIASSIVAQNSTLQSGQQFQLVYTANTTGSGSLSGGTLQLETLSGQAIGTAATITAQELQSNAAFTLTVGQSATGATLSVTLNGTSSIFTGANTTGSYTQTDTFTLGGPNNSTDVPGQTNGWQASTSIAALNIMDQSSAQNAITAIQNAINTMSSSQAQLGAVQDRLNYTVSNLSNSSQNLQNAQSTLTNTDMASAYTKFSQQQVLEQVGISMLSQAQQQPQMILKLLQ